MRRGRGRGRIVARGGTDKAGEDDATSSSRRRVAIGVRTRQGRGRGGGRIVTCGGTDEGEAASLHVEVRMRGRLHRRTWRYGRGGRGRRDFIRVVASLSLSPRSGGGRTHVFIALWVRARTRARAHRRLCHLRCVEVGMMGDGDNDSAHTVFVFACRGRVEGRGKGKAPLSSMVVLTNEP